MQLSSSEGSRRDPLSRRWVLFPPHPHTHTCTRTPNRTYAGPCTHARTCIHTHSLTHAHVCAGTHAYSHTYTRKLYTPAHTYTQSHFCIPPEMSFCPARIGSSGKPTVEWGDGSVTEREGRPERSVQVHPAEALGS